MIDWKSGTGIGDSLKLNDDFWQNLGIGFAILSGVGMLVSHTWAGLFESVLIRTPNENSVLTLKAPEKRESESSGPIFRTDGRNLEGCVRETEISLQTEIAADWAGETRKA